VKLAELFDQTLNELLAGVRPGQLGVAVSGGGDSTALLHLLARWGEKNGCSIYAVTVDHGLREAAVAEAEAVARQCKALGIDHDILTWTDWDQSGNLQDQARRARYRLIAGWAAQRGLENVALGHTLDDQAETVLMRLARGSGVDGLSAMAAVRDADDIRWLRPMLGFLREDLRGFLRKAGADWIEDPSNEDARFDRVKARRVIELLGPLGVTPQGLADTAARMRAARQVLESAAHYAARALARIDGGSVILKTAGLFELLPETRRRLLAHSLCWVAGARYAPRSAALAGLERAIEAKTTNTLHGCLISVGASECTIGREPAVVADVTVPPGEVWDGRWRVTGPEKNGMTIRATGGKGLKSCKNWRQSGFGRATLIAAPAVWLRDELVAAPLAGLANGWRAELILDKNHYYNTILTH
jgi:tRNA(Ile)-lysidine synthase